MEAVVLTRSPVSTTLCHPIFLPHAPCLCFSSSFSLPPTLTLPPSMERREEKEKAKTEMAEPEEEDDDDRKKRIVAVRKSSSGAGAGSQLSPPACQADKCFADLTDAKRYHRRHKVCEYHSKSQVVMVSGVRQRFCQQCSRFHEVSEFDEAKRSCRRRLAGHNERRRKSSSDSNAEGSGRKENHCRQADQSGRMQIVPPGNSNFKHFQIR